jgi:serine/threonine protein kinase
VAHHNVGRWAHKNCCEANVEIVSGSLEVCTIRPVKEGKQLDFVYNCGLPGDFWDDEFWSFTCACGSPHCQGRIDTYRQPSKETNETSTIEAIHEKGIVHFDLKPDNVLAEVLNGSWNDAICDFGFANYLSDVQDKIVKGVKKPTAIGMTARYAAPEFLFKEAVGNFAPNLKSEAPADAAKKIDVYAYALTLFYVYAREAPWKNSSLEEIELLAIAGKRPDRSK